MDVISSNTLFHFTSKFEYLKNILIRGFQSRYCLESFDHFKQFGGVDPFEMAVPMVCFCDIPLSKVRSHMDFYGNYGIGMSKEWGYKSGINPIIYLSERSDTTQTLLNLLETLKSELHANKEGADRAVRYKFGRLLHLVRNSKPYKGKPFRRGAYLQEDRIYYDEREWRFLPKISSTHEVGRYSLAEPWITKEYFLDLIRLKKIENLNDEVNQDSPLPVVLPEMKYLIVDSEAEKFDILNFIKANFHDNSYPTILTRRQLNEDI